MKTINIMKPKPLLSALTIGAAALIFVYWAVYFVLCLTGFDSPLMSILAVFVMAAISLPILFRKRLSRCFGDAMRWLRPLFSALLIFYVITVAVFWCFIGCNAAKTPAHFLDGNGSDTLVLVFGCRTYGMTPSLTLALRLNAAQELLHGLPEAVCVVSGGQGANETVPEALSMKAYLEANGIDATRIFMEDNSHSTSENVRLSKELIASLALDNKRIIGVSTAFHLPRIQALANRYDLPMELCAAPSPTFGHFYVSMVREYLSYIKMLFFDQVVIVSPTA